MLLNGRIARISGLVASIGQDRGPRRWIGAAFVAGPPVFALSTGALPTMRFVAPLPVLAVAGLLVRFGTRLGSGCTSGHGVAGLARL